MSHPVMCLAASFDIPDIRPRDTTAFSNLMGVQRQDKPYTPLHSLTHIQFLAPWRRRIMQVARPLTGQSTSLEICVSNVARQLSLSPLFLSTSSQALEGKPAATAQRTTTATYRTAARVSTHETRSSNSCMKQCSQFTTFFICTQKSLNAWNQVLIYMNVSKLISFFCT